MLKEIQYQGDKSVPKKIRLWKVILLTIVTFSIYTIVWHARRRNEMVKQFKLTIPHWLWLVLPMLITLLFIFPVAIVTLVATGKAELTYPVTMGYVLVGTIASIIISYWWMFKFAVATKKITEGRIPTIWTMLYTIFLGPVTVYMLQYRFNRLPKTVKIDAKPKYKPTKKFIVLSIVAIVVGTALNSLSFSTIPDSLKKYSEGQSQLQSLDKAGDDAERLTNEYQACTSKLEKDFPDDITVETEAAYNAAYAACDQILEQQHEKAEEYNRAINE